MAYKSLFILVEGNDDERLFREKIAPKLEERYDYVKLLKWASLKKDYLKKYMASIRSMGAAYIFIRDNDFSTCITDRKGKIKGKYGFLDERRIFIVVQEIEGWYLAGLNHAASKKLKIKNFKNTSKISKEMFEKNLPKNFSSRIDFMREIIKYFSFETARIKNESFNYFYEINIEQT